MISFMISFVPAVDARDARVGVGPCDRILEHVAIAAVELDAAVDHAALHARCTTTWPRRVLTGQLPVVVREQQRSTNAWRSRPRSASPPARTAVLEGADRTCRMRCARARTRACAERRARRRDAMTATDMRSCARLESGSGSPCLPHRGGSRGGPGRRGRRARRCPGGRPIFSRLRPRSKPGHPALHDQQAEPAVAIFGSVRAATTTRSELMPLVMNVLAPLTISRPRSDGARRDAREVGAGPGLGHRDRGQIVAVAIPGSQRSRCSSLHSS